MKKVKLAIWVVIIGLFALVVYQNQDFFLSRHSLGINLYFAVYRSIALPNAVLFAAFFLVGWLIAYVFGLADRYRASRTIKSLRETTSGQQTDLESLRKDIASIKNENTSMQTEEPFEPAAG